MRGICLDKKALALLLAILFVFVIFTTFEVYGQEETAEAAEGFEDEEIGDDVLDVSEDSGDDAEAESSEGSDGAGELAEVNEDEEDQLVYVNLDDVDELDVTDGGASAEEEPVEPLYVNLDDIDNVDSSGEDIVANDLSDLIDPEDSGSEGQEVIDDTEEPGVNDELAGEESEEIAEDIEEAEEEKIRYILYDGGEKQIETEIAEGEEIEISKDEEILELEEEWRKRVSVYSDEHFDNSLRVYVNILESEEDNIEIYWLNEEEEVTNDGDFDVEYYDKDGNGLIERISFVVPHLSEQNFDIVISFEEGDTEASELDLVTLESPTGVIEEAVQLEFDFNLSYNNLSYVLCDFLIEDDLEQEVFAESGEFGSLEDINSSGFSNGDYFWSMYCYDENVVENNDSETGNFTINLDYSLDVDFDSNLNNIIEGEQVIFYVDIYSLDNRTVSYSINFDDGNTTPPNVVNNADLEINHIYEAAGTYGAVLTVVDGSNITNYQETISVGSAGDNDPPLISLLEPDNNDILDADQIDFEYLAEDDSGLGNCTYNLYYFNQSNVGELVYDSFNDTLVNNETVTVSLVNFDEGDYTWEVECHDTQGNYGSRDRDFEFDLNSTEDSSSSNSDQDNEGSELDVEVDFERKEEIEDILDKINEFLVESGRYGKEEKEAIEDLGLVDDLVLYKKKLNQMSLDLEHNIDFISDEERREERKKEIYDEIDEIREKTPVSLEVSKADSYVKNSLDSDISSLVDAYVSSQNLIVNGRAKKSLEEYNRELQNSLSVSIAVKHVEIEYLDDSAKITLISKSLESNEEKGSFMEVVPKEVADDVEEISFRNDFDVVKRDPIVKIERGDLISDKIIYFVEGFVEFSEIEKSDTFIFEESLPEGFSPISGFSVLLDSSTYSNVAIYLSWIIAILVFLVGGFYLVDRVKLNKYKSLEEVRMMGMMIREAQHALQGRDLARAKENYEQIKEIYAFLPEKGKKLVFRRVNGLRVSIDKREAQEIAKECITAIREGRKEDALLLYQELNGLFGRLPGKFRAKIYERLTPYLHMLRE